MTDLRPRETFTRRGDGNATWRVVTVRGDIVGLSGPGLCRSYRSVTLAELARDYIRVPEVVASP